MKLASNDTIRLDQPSDMRELIETLERAMNTWERAPVAVRRLYYNLVAARALAERSITYEQDLDSNAAAIVGPGGQICVINKRLCGLRLWHRKIVAQHAEGGTTIVDLETGVFREVTALELAAQDFLHNER